MNFSRLLFPIIISISLTLSYMSCSTSSSPTLSYDTSSIDSVNHIASNAIDKITTVNSTIDENIVYVKNFNAKGDSITDDTVAIQNALNNSIGKTLIFEKNAQYLITAPLLIHSNTTVDFNNATLLKSTDNAKIVNSTFKTTCNNQNIQIYNLNIRNKGYARGYCLFFYGVNNLEMKNISIYNDSPYYEGANGAWAAYISGKDIVIDEIVIDTYKGGKWADGLHFGYVENLLITNFNISSGDDCIALCPAPRSYYPTNILNKSSSNIVIKNGECSSNMANLIRIGAMYDKTNISNNAEANIVYRDVTISDITYTVEDDSTAKLFAFEDMRLPECINGRHDNINISNINIIGVFKVRTMTIYGNVSSNCENGLPNYGCINLNNIHITEDTKEAMINAYGIDTLNLNNCSFMRDKSSIKENRMFNFHNISNVNIENCIIEDYSKAHTIVTKSVNTVSIINTYISGICYNKKMDFTSIPSTNDANATLNGSNYYYAFY